MMSSSFSDEPIVSVQDVSLVFRSDIHRPWSFKEAFTRAVQDPVAALTVKKDRLHLLNGISFNVSHGERIGLIGVNGTGKTSLCRCIAGIYRPTKGKIKVRGLVRAIFDTAIGILPELTGRENAMLLARFMYPLEVDRHEEMVREALEFSELGEFVDVPYKFYSNGMQARLCLSIASCIPGDLLILDEVFDGADTFFREKISARILRIIRESGAAIFVSHSADQIQQVCNRVILLKEGKVAYDGPVKEGLEIYHAKKHSSFVHA